MSRPRWLRARLGRPRSDPKDGAALFTPAFVALALAELAYFTAFGLMIPVVPLFVVGPLAASLWVSVWWSAHSA